MRKRYFIFLFFIFCGISIFCDNDNRQEIDFLLFLPNSSNQFIDEEQAFVQLDNLARYLLNINIASGQIIVNGYAAFVQNNIESVELSRERAVFVINELQKRGVPKDLFSEPVGHGSVYLWGDNTEEDDRKPNRRVRILLGGESPTPITPEIVGNEIGPAISDAAQGLPFTQAPTSPVGRPEKSGFKFPWWILLALPLFLILFFLLKNKSRKTAHENATASGQKRIPETDAIIGYEAVFEQAPAPSPKPAPPPKNESVSSPAKTEVKVNLDEEIRLRAYELSEKRNWHGDYREQDWYDAMREVSALYIYRGYTVYFKDGCWWAAG